MIYTGADRAELIGLLAEGEARITVTLTVSEINLLLLGLAMIQDQAYNIATGIEASLAYALESELIDARMCAR